MARCRAVVCVPTLAVCHTWQSCVDWKTVSIDHFFFASVILGFLVILGKQLFSGLVGSSGNRRVAFASLSDFDIEVGYWQFV